MSSRSRVSVAQDEASGSRSGRSCAMEEQQMPSDVFSARDRPKIDQEVSRIRVAHKVLCCASERPKQRPRLPNSAQARMTKWQVTSRARSPLRNPFLYNLHGMAQLAWKGSLLENVCMCHIRLDQTRSDPMATRGGCNNIYQHSTNQRAMLHSTNSRTSAYVIHACGLH